MLTQVDLSPFLNDLQGRGLTVWYKRKNSFVTAASLESLYGPSFAQRCRKGDNGAAEMALNVFDECCQASAGLYELSG